MAKSTRAPRPNWTSLVAPRNASATLLMNDAPLPTKTVPCPPPPRATVIPLMMPPFRVLTLISPCHTISKTCRETDPPPTLSWAREDANAPRTRASASVLIALAVGARFLFSFRIRPQLKVRIPRLHRLPLQRPLPVSRLHHHRSSKR